jgi:hypothetical protein
MPAFAGMTGWVEAVRRLKRLSRVEPLGTGRPARGMSDAQDANLLITDDPVPANIRTGCHQLAHIGVLHTPAPMWKVRETVTRRDKTSLQFDGSPRIEVREIVDRATSRSA